MGEVVPYLRVLGICRTRQTIYNWANHGVERGLGRTVKLRTINRIGILCTTREWLQDFIAEVSE